MRAENVTLARGGHRVSREGWAVPARAGRGAGAPASSGMGDLATPPRKDRGSDPPRAPLPRACVAWAMCETLRSLPLAVRVR